MFDFLFKEKRIIQLSRKEADIEKQEKYIPIDENKAINNNDKARYINEENINFVVPHLIKTSVESNGNESEDNGE